MHATLTAHGVCVHQSGSATVLVLVLCSIIDCVLYCQNNNAPSPPHAPPWWRNDVQGEVMTRMMRTNASAMCFQARRLPRLGTQTNQTHTNLQIAIDIVPCNGVYTLSHIPRSLPRALTID